LRIPKLAKQEACYTLPLSDKFTLLSLRDNKDQLANAYRVSMRLVVMTKCIKRFNLLEVLCIIKINVNEKEIYSSTILEVKN